jgi:hypothetical protein
MISIDNLINDYLNIYTILTIIFIKIIHILIKKALEDTKTNTIHITCKIKFTNIQNSNDKKIEYLQKTIHPKGR